jgi:hypothetical protein
MKQHETSTEWREEILMGSAGLMYVMKDMDVLVITN